ncbi:hypothetical protein ACYZT8_21105 [Pseudomonas sp. LB3P93]
MSVDPLEIEDTSDWLGCPTALETIKHYASMLEEDIQELKLELRAAKENITGLIAMNDQLSSEIQRKNIWMANLQTQTSEQLSEISSLKLVKSQNESCSGNYRKHSERSSP